MCFGVLLASMRAGSGSKVQAIVYVNCLGVLLSSMHAERGTVV